MPAPFQQMLDSTYSRLGENAVYTPPGGGTAVNVTVMRMTQGDGLLDGFNETRHIGAGGLFAVRVSELAAPARDGALALGGVSYTVQAKPRHTDEQALEWRLDCAKD